MMLQRKDLAKEFSLIVQQEIKNHADAVLSCNMALDEFRRKLSEVQERCDKKIAELHSHSGKHEAAFSLLQEKINAAICNCQRQVSDMATLYAHNFKGLKNTLDDRESYFLTIEGFQEFQSDVEQWMSNIKLSFALQKDVFLAEVVKATEKLNSTISMVKSDVYKIISDEISERKEINKQLDVFAINFSGYTRELDIIKKRCFVLEKNIENLYTQIERLKEGTKCHKPA